MLQGAGRAWSRANQLRCSLCVFFPPADLFLGLIVPQQPVRVLCLWLQAIGPVFFRGRSRNVPIP